MCNLNKATSGISQSTGHEILRRFSTGPVVLSSATLREVTTIFPRSAVNFCLRHLGGVRKMLLPSGPVFFSLRKVVGFRRQPAFWEEISGEILARYSADSSYVDGSITMNSPELPPTPSSG